MTVIDDLVSAANEYPTTSVVVEIADVTFPGTVINSSEEGKFTVAVTNSGPLEIDQLKLTISGENGVQVKSNTALSTYGPSFDIQMLLPIPPNSTVKTTGLGGALYGFKAPSTSWADSKVLIKATLDDFNVNLDSMFSNLSGPSPALKWTYKAVVNPT